MAVNLAAMAPARESDPLRIMEVGTCKSPRLAVAESANGELVLVAERTRNKLGADGKRDKANGTESHWKRTSSLRDFAAGIACGLLVFDKPARKSAPRKPAAVVVAPVVAPAAPAPAPALAVA